MLCGWRAEGVGGALALHSQSEGSSPEGCLMQIYCISPVGKVWPTLNRELLW